MTVVGDGGGSRFGFGLGVAAAEGSESLGL